MQRLFFPNQWKTSGILPILSNNASLSYSVTVQLPFFFANCLGAFLEYTAQRNGVEGGASAAIWNERAPILKERLFGVNGNAGEFLSDYGLRSLSRAHAEDPYQCRVGDQTYTVRYEPAESRSGLFGGNSNWRGPIWFPINFMLIEALHKYDHHYGDTMQVEALTGSGRMLSLGQAAAELSRRLTRILLRNEEGRRPVFGGETLFQRDPHWRDYLLFYEYFHGDNGAGLGASHQTGWTPLVANLLQQEVGNYDDR